MAASPRTPQQRDPSCAPSPPPTWLLRLVGASSPRSPSGALVGRGGGTAAVPFSIDSAASFSSPELPPREAAPLARARCLFGGSGGGSDGNGSGALPAAAAACDDSAGSEQSDRYAAIGDHSWDRDDDDGFCFGDDDDYDFGEGGGSAIRDNDNTMAQSDGDVESSAGEDGGGSDGDEESSMIDLTAPSPTRATAAAAAATEAHAGDRKCALPLSLCSAGDSALSPGPHAAPVAVAATPARNSPAGSTATPSSVGSHSTLLDIDDEEDESGEGSDASEEGGGTGAAAPFEDFESSLPVNGDDHIDCRRLSRNPEIITTPLLVRLRRKAKAAGSRPRDGGNDQDEESSFGRSSSSGCGVGNGGVSPAADDHSDDYVDGSPAHQRLRLLSPVHPHDQQARHLWQLGQRDAPPQQIVPAPPQTTLASPLAGGGSAGADVHPAEMLPPTSPEVIPIEDSDEDE